MEGAGAPAVYIGAARAETNTVSVTAAPVIDVSVIRAIAEQQGYLPPEEKAALEERLVRAVAELDSLRGDRPDTAPDIEAAAAALQGGDAAAAESAFDDVEAGLAAQASALRREQASVKHARATLLHPFEVSKSAPLLLEAAQMAGTEFRYWIEAGRALLQTGARPAAADAFATAEKLAREAAEERNVPIALDCLGDVRLAEGDRAGAHAAYGKGLAIRRELAKRNPGDAEAALDVSASLTKLGDIRLAEGGRAGALAAYEEGLIIRRDFAKRDPGNAELERNVSVSLTKVGNVRVAKGDRAGALAAWEEALSIQRDLAKRDPSNAVWARDVSVSLSKIGNVRLAEGDRAGALAAWEEGLAIHRDLAKRDPGNASWARDVSVSLSKIGDVRLAGGDRAGALVAWKEDLAIARDLAMSDSGNANWARDVVVSLQRMAQADEARAAEYWAEAVERLEVMAARGIIAPVDMWILPMAREELAKARAR